MSSIQEKVEVVWRRVKPDKDFFGCARWFFAKENRVKQPNAYKQGDNRQRLPEREKFVHGKIDKIVIEIINGLKNNSAQVKVGSMDNFILYGWFFLFTKTVLSIPVLAAYMQPDAQTSGSGYGPRNYTGHRAMGVGGS